VPEDAPGPNRQGLDHKNIESHFETLPSGSVERKKVDFGNGTTNALGYKTSPTGVNPGGRVLRKGPSTPRAPMTAAELKEAKLRREKMMDEFHGRVAGIKHNVDVLNDRLTDFEEQVHKDDAKLAKGDPNAFKVDLG
jgi:hypothetical protein